MKSYSDLEIEVLFDRLWGIYPSKERESAARKAFTVALRSGEDPKKIEQAIKIYRLESEGSEFLFYFNNFLNEEHWKDIVSAHANVDEYLQSLQDHHDLAAKVLEEWNKKCRKHWCQCLDIDVRVPLVKKALRDDSFSAHWKKALDIAHGVFYKRLHESHKFGRVNLTIRWFCSIDPEKHTVLRLIEGEFGYAEKEVIKPLPKPISKKEKEELSKLWEEVMNDDGIDDFDFE